MKQWSEIEESILKNNVLLYKNIDLIRLLPNRTLSSIRSKINKLGIKSNHSLSHRKYTFDYDYFSKPTIENCYWAGLIASDGNIGKDGCVKIGLIDKDIKTIEKFKHHCKYTGQIKTYIPKRSNESPMKTIYVWGAYKWQKDLKKYWNITPNKTLTLQPPNITNKKHIAAYIMGLFDGDGGIHIGKNGLIRTTYSGNLNIINWIKEQFDKISKPTRNNKIQKHKKGNVYYYTLAGKRTIKIHNILKDMTKIDWMMGRKWNTLLNQNQQQFI